MNISILWQAPTKKNELAENLMLAIPTFFDLIATILMNVGLLYVTASVYQMMRGAGDITIRCLLHCFAFV